MGKNKAQKLFTKIEKHYKSHGAEIEIFDYEIIENDDIERYVFDVKLLRGTKVTLLHKCSKDIQMSLQLPLFEVVEEGLSIKIVVSEDEVTENSLIPMLRSPQFADARKKMQIPYAIGYDAMGKMLIEDLVTFPHSLSAGSTNSGKTLSLKALLMSIAWGCSEDEVNLLIFDIGVSDLSLFNKLPHLSYPVIKDVETGIMVMTALNAEMNRRIRLQERSKSIFSKLTHIVCVIDEYLSLISEVTDKVISKRLIENISNLLRRGRHAKIHMVIAAQNPTIANMKCDLGNITARMAFKCAKGNYSQTILGDSGAEKLTVKGSMLLKLPKYDVPQFVKGAFISSNDIRKALEHIRLNKERNQIRTLKQTKIALDRMKYRFRITESDLKPTITEPISTDSLNNQSKFKQEQDDKLIAEIIMYLLERKSISCKTIEETFRLGYRKASGILEKLNEWGIVGDLYVKLPRVVLPISYEDLTPEIVEFLNGQGFASERIRETLNGKSSSI